MVPARRSLHSSHDHCNCCCICSDHCRINIADLEFESRKNMSPRIGSGSCRTGAANLVTHARICEERA